MKQINELGGHVCKGESQANGRGATTIMLFKSYIPRHAEPDPDTGKVEERPVARLFKVFNGEQCEGLPERFASAAENGPEALAEPQTLLDAYLAHGGPALRHRPGDRAYYNAEYDQITLPPREQFKSAELYYASAYHEVGHSTGHQSRLDRPGIATFDHFRLRAVREGGADRADDLGHGLRRSRHRHGRAHRLVRRVPR